MGCLARCTAKLFVITFSVLLLALSIVAIAGGAFSIAQFDATFLAGAVPAWAAWVTIGVGVLLAIFALVAMFGVSCCLHKSKTSLCLISVFTLLFAVMFGAATVTAFQYSALIKLAADHGFADEVDAGVTGFYTGLRDAYTKAYVQCNATAYMTDNVRAACKTQAALPWNTLNVTDCAADAYDSGAARVGLYCRDGPGLEPFSVDRALAFPHLDGRFDFAGMLRLRSLGYFMSAACMPTQERYYQLVAELITLATPGVLLPTGVKAKAANSTFGKCYQSKWWGQNTADLDAATRAAVTASPAIPPGFKTDPETGAALDGQRKLFFDALQASRTALLGNPYLSAKLSFCFCADEGSNSKLIVFLRETIFGNVQWICLGLAIFFALAFVAEIYLGCCVPHADLHEHHPQVALRGWSAGGLNGANPGRAPSKKYAQPSNLIIRP